MVLMSSSPHFVSLLHPFVKAVFFDVFYASAFRLQLFLVWVQIRMKVIAIGDFYGVRFCACCLQCLTSPMIFAICEYANFVLTFGDWWLSLFIYLNGTMCRLGHAC